MGPAPGIGERLLALEAAVSALQAEVRELATSVAWGAAKPAPTPEPAAKNEPSGLEQLAQRLGNARLAAVLVRAGYTSLDAGAAAPDEALLAVDGVGDKALKLIREKVG
jgi:hypothetical protein